MEFLFGSFGEDYGFLTIAMILILIYLIFRMISQSVRLTRLEKKYKAFMKGSDAASLEKTFLRKLEQIDRLYETKEDHDQKLKDIQQSLDTIYTKYGVEKYDAFEDVGGKLSFALALLDQNNTGLILNAVHSRDNCFLYLKEIVKGESYVMLSQEEVEALRKAVNFHLE
jgi:hypothetical protein